MVFKSIFDRAYKALGLLVIGALTLSALAIPARAAQTPPAGKIRFIHAVPGGPALNVYIGAAVAASGLAFGQATRYLNVGPAEIDVSLAASGSGMPILSDLVTIPGDMVGRTVVIQQDGQGGIELASYDDELSPARAGFIRFAAIHAIQGAPAVDVLQVDGQNVTPLVQGLSFGQPYGTVDIPASSGDLVIVPTNADVSSTVAKAEKVSLVAGTYNVVVALGTLDGAVKPSALLVTAPLAVEAPAASALVRLVHGSAEAPAVDAYVNSVLIAPGLELGAATPHIGLAAGTAKVELRAAGSAADSAPIASVDLTLEAGKALTAVVNGPTDGLKITTSEDNIAALSPTKARIHLVNPAGEATATVGGASVASTQAAGVEIDPGVYDLSVVSGETTLTEKVAISGGVLYDVIVLDNRLVIAATGLDERPGSAPGAPPAIAAAPTATAVSVAVATATPLPVSPTPLQLAVTPPPPAGTPTSVPVFVPTGQPPVPTDVPTAETPIMILETLPPQQVQPGLPSATPFGATGVTGTVDTDPGVNLKIREYPREDAKTLGLAPSGAVLVIEGVRGPALGRGTPTPEATATLNPEGVSLEQVWVFVRWNIDGGGGTLTGWTKAFYLILTNDRGRRLSSVQDIFALRQIPEDTFGEISANVTPVGPDAIFIIGTVTVDPGVNLQLRRTPGIDGESLTLLPAGVELIVLEKTEVQSQGGLVGEPASLIWLFVRYQTESGSITGWVNSQFLVLKRRGQPVSLDEVPVAAEIQRGGTVGSPAVITPPPPSGLIATIDKLDPGVNLQLRRNPDAGAESLGLIPAGTQLPVTGRNGAGTWLRVNYNAIEGWVSSAYVSVTRNGRPVPIHELENVTDEPDIAGTPTVTPTPAAGG